MLYNTTLEPTAVSRITPSPGIFGRRSFGMPGREDEASASVAGSGTSRPTDATGLSRSTAEIAEAIAAFDRERAAMLPEVNYRAAGAQFSRQAGAALFTDSALFMVGRFAEPDRMGGSLVDPAPERATDAAPLLHAGAVIPGAGRGQTASIGPNRANQSAGQHNGSDPAESTMPDHAREQELADLKARDAQVRAHEQAHVALGGGLVTGGASYSFETGPDGTRYAVAGEVRIDTSRESTPDETIEKARTVRASALAPAEPSAQDRAVAAEASRMEAEARTEKTNHPEEDPTPPIAAMQTARLAYAQAHGITLPAPYGTGVSLAI